MQSFLDKFVEYYLKNHEGEAKKTLVILPSKRAVAALKTAFTRQDKTIWLPEIIDIVKFIERLSGLNILGKEKALLLLHHVYNSTKKTKEPFESFYGWGSTLLSDFNEIDRFLIDTDQFFEHHKALKELYYFGEKKTDLIKSYISFWERLPNVYQNYKTSLLQKKEAYQGLAYRKACENIEDFNLDQGLIFLGFNALNKAEEQIFETLLKRGKAKVAWDIDPIYLQEKHHPANRFIRKYLSLWDNYKDNFINLETHDTYHKSIEVIPTPKNIGQAKAVANILKNFDTQKVQNTAIVLNDENLINPILNSIPESIKDVNITMGIPLGQSSYANFFDSLFTFQKEANIDVKYNFLKSILNSEILNYADHKEKHQILDYLETKKISSITFDGLDELISTSSLIKKLLVCLKITENPTLFLNNVQELILAILQHQQHSAFLLSYQYLFSQLVMLLKEEKHLSMTAVLLLFRDMQKDQKLSFKGSKTSGIQVMGMLETRLLDFENIIMTSVNEGILPSGKSDNSYITYSLKKDYGLPTHTEKDAVYAYHFFRLLQRSKKCFLIYDNDQTGFNKGDKSRFITYLEVFKNPNIKIETNPFALDTGLEKRRPMRIVKTNDIMTKIKALSDSGFSPTALSAYISNPIKFYKKYVLNVKEQNSINNVIDARDFGSVVHNTLEDLYKNKSVLKLEDLDTFEKNYEENLKKRYSEFYASEEYQKGQNRIQFEIARSYINRFLDIEKKNLKKHPVEIIDIEKKLEAVISTSNSDVKLKGKIDRIDKCNGNLRIIDLKTGFTNTSNLKFDDFEDIVSDEEKAKIFQTLFYAYLFYRNYKVKEIQAGIISFKNLGSWFMPVKHIKNNLIDEEFLKAFESKLLQLINEILDPNIPFIEKESIFES
jgi:hypothetical protein